MMYRLTGLLALVAALVGVPPGAEATTMRKIDLDTLVATADVILLGTVGSSESVAVGARFWTRTTLVPERVVKGAVEGPVVVETAGGVVDGIGQRVAGSAQFTEGEQVVVFLARRPDGRLRVRGMAQGKLRVVPGLAGGRAVRDLSDLRLIADDGAEVEAADVMPLDAFLKDLAVRVVRDAGTLPERPRLLDPPTDTPTGGAR